MHRGGRRLDGPAGFEVVENLGEANQRPVARFATASKEPQDETECLPLIDQHGRGPSRLVARDDKRFGLAPIELIRTLRNRHEVANLCHARLLNPKPSVLDATADLVAVLAKLAVTNPWADDHVGVYVPEKSERSDPAERDERGSIADERHLAD